MAAAGRRAAQSLGQGCPRQELRRHREIPMKILVVGGGGQVACAVVGTVPPSHAVIEKNHAELDITDEAAVVRALSETPVDWIVNGAAYTAVDQAEEEPARAARPRGRGQA